MGKDSSVLRGGLLLLLIFSGSCQSPPRGVNSPDPTPSEVTAEPSAASLARLRVEKLSLQLLDRAERERSLQLSFLERMLRHDSPAVRQKAAQVVGRTRFKLGGTALLGAAASERDDLVRQEIAFSLGQIEEGNAIDLLARWSEESQAMPLRIAAITGLGRIRSPGEEGTEWSTRVVSILTSIIDEASSDELRREASLAVWRHEDAAVAAIPALTRRLMAETDDDPWPHAYALMRIDHADTSAPLRWALSHRSGLVRTYAAWGARQPLDPSALEGLEKLLDDEKSPWTARVEALRSLGKLREEGLEESSRCRDVLLRHLIREQHPLVAPLVVESLGKAPTEIELPFIMGSLDLERPAAVRSAAVIALASAARSNLLERKNCAQILEQFATEESPWLRSSCATAIASLGRPGFDSLQPFLTDADGRVRSTAVAGLQQIDDPVVEAAIDRALADSDVSVRMPAVELVGSKKLDGWQERLKRCWTRSLGDDSWEVRVMILDLLADSAEGKMMARNALEDRFRTVRSAAARVLEVPVSPRAGRSPAKRIEPDQMTGVGPPRVFIELEMGMMAVELDLEAAPLHVSSFIDGVRRKQFDGRIFHRVVPSFVAQGGCPRGDGWGDEGWHLVDEIHPRPYRKGTLGMPKAGDDTGGSQIFITHLPTPHLDGRYTVFGQVVEGLDLLDQIEVGTRILRMTVDENRFRKRVAF